MTCCEILDSHHKLCSKCKDFILEYFTQSRQDPAYFQFNHYPPDARRMSAKDGCLACELAIRVALYQVNF
jgi:hypothetical protein